MKAAQALPNKISASKLKGISVCAEDDLFDLARLLVRVLKAKDIADARDGVMNRSYLTVHGIVGVFAGAISSIESIHDRAEQAVKAAGVSLDAVLVPDDELDEKGNSLGYSFSIRERGSV